MTVIGQGQGPKASAWHKFACNRVLSVMLMRRVLQGSFLSMPGLLWTRGMMLSPKVITC